MSRKTNSWTKEQHEFIINNTLGNTNKALTKMFNEKFKTSATVSAIKNQKVKLCVGNERCFNYSDEHIEFIIKNSNGTSSVKITEMFNEHFGTNLTLGQMKSFRGRFKIKCGVNETQFKKGKMPNETSFKKGNTPHKTLPIGSERVNVFGFIEVKTSDGNINAKKNWKLKHRFIWEQHYKRPAPKNHVVIFADGDNRNFDLDNLILAPKNQYSTMLRNGLLFDNADLTKTGALIAELKVKLVEKEKEIKK